MQNLFTLFTVILKVFFCCPPPTGWWLVENEDKRLAWFPAPYLELWEGEEDDDDAAGFQLGGAILTPAHLSNRNISFKLDYTAAL